MAAAPGAPSEHPAHRLVAINASGPGAGKSTLAAALVERLTQAGTPARWLSEQDLIGRAPFARCSAALRRNDPAAVELFVDAAHALAAEHGGRPETWIVDSMLPGFAFLLGRYPLARLERYRDEVARALQPLRPLLVYLTGDPAVFLARAEARSGPGFAAHVLEAIREISLPHYPSGPVQTEEDMHRLFSWADAQTRRMLEGWPGPVRILDPVATTPAGLLAAVLPDLV